MKNKSNIINQIENVRKRNNKCWMDILRLAFKHDPKNAAKIVKKIHSDDKKISSLVKKLGK